ncbi:MAG TPA: bifunctional hydroxymethylpyrimidine kinase/phosphomethylpyrimidine kinase [Firmicutes bacterium]|jgi:hydroxymethylpyrimidine/phosphomethylpyrimidine kinase|nr:bifunctional hydroxymethylpyrimidine kinase/phosphomethylpyrimidine kinase [Bacillota bacterium]
MKHCRVLTIAGTDSGGGAGIQADLKTFTVMRAYGMSVIAAVTAQNTMGVQGVYPLAPEAVGEQLESVFSDIGADAVKTGMLFSAPIITEVAAKLRKFNVSNLVVDPVMIAKGGSRLLEEEATAALKDELLPLTTVITPNIPEAEVLTGVKITTVDDMKTAAKQLVAMGVQAAVVKGGHLTADPIDVLFDGKQVSEFVGRRYQTKNTHGTGCTFSAALAVGLAHGLDLSAAVQQAKDFVSLAISKAVPIGHGHGPTNHLAWLDRTPLADN